MLLKSWAEANVTPLQTEWDKPAGYFQRCTLLLLLLFFKYQISLFAHPQTVFSS